MLSEIEIGGEEKVKEFTENFDKYSGNIVVTPEEVEVASSKISKQLKDDISFSYERVYKFAKKHNPKIKKILSNKVDGQFYPKNPYMSLYIKKRLFFIFETY